MEGQMRLDLRNVHVAAGTAAVRVRLAILRFLSETKAVFFLKSSIFFLFMQVSFAQNLFPESYDSMTNDEQLEPYSSPLIIRNRQAVMDSYQLFESISQGNLVLNLFADAEFRAEVKTAKPLPTGASFMSGSLENGGHITLYVSNEGIVRGEVHSPRGTYTIRSSKGTNSNNNLIVRQIDTSKLTPIDDGTVNFHSDQSDSPEKPSGDFSVYNNSSAEELPLDETVDVLVVYTPDAETSEGGKAEIEASIRAEVAKTNQAFENSGLSHRKIRLVAMKKMDYTESTVSMAENLSYLREKKGEHDPEGRLDEVHALRDRYAAEIVHLFLGQTIRYCGVGSTYNLYSHKFVERFCANDPQPDECIVRKRTEVWRYSGFSISGIPPGCTVQNAFTHELGHSFGLFHDRYSRINDRPPLSLVEPIQFPYRPYGFGYVNQNFSRSKCSITIMAYGDQCLEEGGYSRTVGELMFSNPDLQLGSEEVGYDPAGVAGDEWTVDLDGPVNASRAIDEAWDIVANLYHSSTSCAGQLFSSIPSPVRISAAGGTSTYTLTSPSADYCSSDDLNLSVESSSSLITASVETEAVTNDAGDQSYEYNITITSRVNNSCRSRTGTFSLSGDDGVSRTFSIRQRIPRLCGLISEASSDTTAESIVSLNFSGENIGHIGNFLFTALTGLESLNLSDNSLKILPAGAFAKATELGDLDDTLSRQDQIHLIGNNRWIAGLVNLKTLNLSNNLIHRLHALTFRNLFNLEELDLSKNRLRTLPANVFSDLVKLEELNLGDNQIRGLPAALFVDTESLRGLNMSNNQIRVLPAAVFDKLTELEELDLSDNQIANLPTNVFSKTTEIEYLWLHGNKITRITAGAFNTLTNLKGLALDGNAIRALSANVFSKTTELEYLWLSADELTSISSSVFSRLTELKYLNLSLDKVTALPGNLISRLTELRYLNLSLNKVTTLPRNIFARAANVRYLRLSGESLTNLPAQVCTFISNVDHVRVSGFSLDTVCPSSATGATEISVKSFLQKVADVASDGIGNNNAGTSVGQSNAGAGFQVRNGTVIIRMYEDSLEPLEISRLTGYDEGAISRTIAKKSLLQ